MYGITIINLHLQINTNGYIRIARDVQGHGNGPIYGQFPSGDGVPLLAPYNSDIDFGAYTPGFLSYRLDTTPDILARATDAVLGIRQYAQERPDFLATWTLIVTWHEAVFHDYEGADGQVVSLQTTHSSHDSRS